MATRVHGSIEFDLLSRETFPIITLRLALLAPKGTNRVDFGCAACGQPACKQRHQAHDQQGDSE